MGKRLFISYDGEDIKLANLIKELFCCGTKGLLNDEIFCDTFATREPPPEQIRQALCSCEAVICIMTPDSIWEPWVTFEAGGGFFAFNTYSSKLHLVSAHKIMHEKLPKPLSGINLKVHDLANTEDLEWFYKEVAKVLGISNDIADVKNSLEKIKEEASTSSGDWRYVRQALIVERGIGESPFNFKRLLAIAKTNFLLVGQNCHFLVRNMDISENKDALFNRLRSGVNVKILISDINDPVAVKAWERITDVANNRYKRDLRESTKKFQVWQQEANEQRLPLDIRATFLSPLSLTIINASEGDSIGKIVLTPMANGDSNPTTRTCFVISQKEHSEAFKHLKSVYYELFNAAKPILTSSGVKSWLSRFMQMKTKIQKSLKVENKNA